MSTNKSFCLTNLQSVIRLCYNRSACPLHWNLMWTSLYRVENPKTQFMMQLTVRAVKSSLQIAPLGESPSLDFLSPTRDYTRIIWPTSWHCWKVLLRFVYSKHHAFLLRWIKISQCSEQVLSWPEFFQHDEELWGSQMLTECCDTLVGQNKKLPILFLEFFYRATHYLQSLR